MVEGVMIFNRSQLHNTEEIPDGYGKIVFKNKESVEGGCGFRYSKYDMVKYCL